MTKTNKGLQFRRILLILVHIVCWLVFLSIPTVFNPLEHGYSLSVFIEDLLLLPRWTNALLLIVVFYFNYNVAIPRYYMGRKHFLLVLSFIGIFGAFFLLNYVLTLKGMGNPQNPGFRALGNSFYLFMFIIVYLFSFAIYIYEQWQSTKEQMLNTEISFLKAQINPHFLFNTLNSIYALTLVKSDKSPDAVVRLSGMMRYAVSEANFSQVPLSKEVDYISNYIELQKLRITEKIMITYEVVGDPEDKDITPFLLIPFVENAFKYGVNAEENSDIWIKIEINDSDLYMQIENNKVFVKKGKDYGTGLGIDNTKKRLQLLYPGKHFLKINDGKYDFKVSLQIQLK
jgi:sensor histidine kinase YesM